MVNYCKTEQTSKLVDVKRKFLTVLTNTKNRCRERSKAPFGIDQKEIKKKGERKNIWKGSCTSQENRNDYRARLQAI